MIIDSRNEFCDATSVAAAAGTALVGNVIDLGAEVYDIGVSGPLYLVMTCDTAVITGGSAGTISFSLASDAQAAIATDGSATVHFSTGSFVTDDAALNDLDAGAVIAMVQLPMGTQYERYLGILATVGTTTVTEGAINAFLTPVAPQRHAYPDNVK